MADDTDELHRFAARLGIYRSSYQGPPRTNAPHYDVTAFERRRAITLGARPCSRQEIVAVLRQVRVGRSSLVSKSIASAAVSAAGVTRGKDKPAFRSDDSRADRDVQQFR